MSELRLKACAFAVAQQAHAVFMELCVTHLGNEARRSQVLNRLSRVHVQAAEEKEHTLFVAFKDLLFNQQQAWWSDLQQLGQLLALSCSSNCSGVHYTLPPDLFAQQSELLWEELYDAMVQVYYLNPLYFLSVEDFEDRTPGVKCTSLALIHVLSKHLVKSQKEPNTTPQATTVAGGVAQDTEEDSVYSSRHSARGVIPPLPLGDYYDQLSQRGTHQRTDRGTQRSAVSNKSYRLSEVIKQHPTQHSARSHRSNRSFRGTPRRITLDQY